MQYWTHAGFARNNVSGFWDLYSILHPVFYQIAELKFIFLAELCFFLFFFFDSQVKI